MKLIFSIIVVFLSFLRKIRETMKSQKYLRNDGLEIGISYGVAEFKVDLLQVKSLTMW